MSNSMADTKGLRAYTDFVRRQTGNSELAFSRLPEHTSIVVGIVFDVAQKEVAILTDDLDKSVYGQPLVVDSAVGFLKRNPSAKIQIIARGDIEPSHPFIVGINKAGLQNSLELSTILASANAVFQFIVADGQHYRFQRERSNPEGIFQFNDSEFGKKLQLVFDRMQATAQPTPNPPTRSPSQHGHSGEQPAA